MKVKEILEELLVYHRALSVKYEVWGVWKFVKTNRLMLKVLITQSLKNGEIIRHK